MPITIQNLRFDNYTLFKLARSGYSIRDMFLSLETDEEKFCKAWAMVLNIEYNGNAKSFINEMGDFYTIFNLNDFLVSILQRDGIIKNDNKQEASK